MAATRRSLFAGAGSMARRPYKCPQATSSNEAILSQRREEFVTYAGCDLEILYRNAAGTIPKEYLMQREIQRITPEIRLFLLHNNAAASTRSCFKPLP